MNDVISFGANRKLLKTDAVPFMFREQLSDLNIEIIEEDDASHSSFIESFEDFCVGVEEKFSHLTDLKTYMNADGCCMYQLSANEQFTDVFMRLKICVNKNFKTTVICEGIEEDISSIVSNSQLLYWTQFYTIIEKFYEQKCENLVELDSDKIIEEIIYDDEPEVLSEVKVEHESDNNLMETASAVEYIENDFLEENDDYVEDDNRGLTIESMEECENSFETLKCPNCLITFKTETGLTAHAKTCFFPKNITIDHQSKICNHCHKEFLTVKGLKTHMKTHFAPKNVKCDFCDLVMYSGSLSRHIRSVHLKEKPFKW
jgi:C2H2-type zinc finger